MSSASHLFRSCWINIQQGENASQTFLMHRSVSCMASESRHAVFNSAQLQTPHGTTPTKLKQPVFLQVNYLNSATSARNERIRTSHCGRANAVNGIEAGAGDMDKKGTVSGPEKEDKDEDGDDDQLTDDDELDLDEEMEPEFEEEEDSDELGKVQINNSRGSEQIKVTSKFTSIFSEPHSWKTITGVNPRAIL